MQFAESVPEHSIESPPSINTAGQITPMPLIYRKVDQSSWLIVRSDSGMWCYLDKQEHTLIRQLHQAYPEELAQRIGVSPERLLAFIQGLAQRGLVSANGDRVIRREQPTIQADTFILTLILSNQCNLACRYCYFDAVRQTRVITMSLETARVALDIAFSQPYPRLIIDLGEIAVVEPQFRALVAEIRSRQAQSSKLVTVAIHTNGTTLNSRSLSFIRDHDIFVGLSLDGPPELHDQGRPTRSGKGSYRRLIPGVREIIRLGIPHIVSCTVSQINVRHAAKILQHFSEIGIRSHVFKPVLRRGSAVSQWDALGISGGEFRRFLDEATEYAIVSGQIDLLDEHTLVFLRRALGDPRGWRSLCPSEYCGCGDSMLVVNPAGYCYPCPRFSFSSTGDYRLESLSLPRARGDDIPIHPRDAVRSQLLPERCHNCPWVALCAGGCHLSRLEAEVKGESDSACEMSRATCDMIFDRLMPALLSRRFGPSMKLGQVQVVGTLPLTDRTRCKDHV